MAADAGYTRPGRPRPHAPRASSRACASRTTAPARSARTSGPTPARRRIGSADPRHQPQPLADLLALLGPDRRAWGALEPARSGRPGARSPTMTAPSTASGGSSDPRDRTALGRRGSRDAELLIADGHHRYETARVYARGDRRRGAPPLRADVPGRARGPGPHRLPTHRLVRGLAEPEQQGARRSDLSATSTSRDWAPRARAARQAIGSVDSATSTSTASPTADVQGPGDCRPPPSLAVAGLPPPRHGVLEALMLKGRSGLSDEDIDHLHGLRLRADVAQALALLERAPYRRRLLPAPDPGRAGPRGRRDRREHAAEVDLLLPEGADGTGLQPADP